MTDDPLRKAAETAVEALERIYRVGDGYNEHRPEDGKYAGTTGEGHSQCRQIAHDALSPLRAALEAGESGWRPIETAPKDKTHFLVWDAHYGTRIGKAHVRADHDDWLSYVDAHGNSSKGGIRATHWMPLPLPPTPPKE